MCRCVFYWKNFGLFSLGFSVYKVVLSAVQSMEALCMSWTVRDACCLRTNMYTQTEHVYKTD